MEGFKLIFKIFHFFLLFIWRLHLFVVSLKCQTIITFKNRHYEITRNIKTRVRNTRG